MRLRCGGIFSNHFIAHVSQSVCVKEFLKSVNIWCKFEQKLIGIFMTHGV